MAPKTEGLTEGILHLQLIIQSDPVRDLLVLFDQVESFRDDWVVLELVPPDLEQNLNHILNPLVDRPFMQDSSESLKDSVVRLGRVFGQESSDFSHESDGDLDTVVCRLFEHQDEHLQGDNLVSDRLVDEMSNEGSSSLADNLRMTQ